MKPNSSSWFRLFAIKATFTVVIALGMSECNLLLAQATDTLATQPDKLSAPNKGPAAEITMAIGVVEVPEVRGADPDLLRLLGIEHHIEQGLLPIEDYVTAKDARDSMRDS